MTSFLGYLKNPFVGGPLIMYFTLMLPSGGLMLYGLQLLLGVSPPMALRVVLTVALLFTLWFVGTVVYAYTQTKQRPAKK